MANIVIFGATSGIAQAVVDRYAQEENRIVLVGRDGDKLATLKAHHESCGSKSDISMIVHDFSDLEGQKGLLEEAGRMMGPIDLALVAYGTLPDQEACEQDGLLVEENIKINFASPALLVNRLAELMAPESRGTIAVITSVAGDRGRKSNYAYGAAKAGLSVFVDGLRGRLFEHGVHVVNIKPGFVKTSMTAHLSRGPLFASPDRIAKDIVRTVEKKRDVIYTPFFWRYIMLIIKMIPNKIFKRLSI